MSEAEEAVEETAQSFLAGRMTRSVSIFDVIKPEIEEPPRKDRRQHRRKSRIAVSYSHLDDEIGGGINVRTIAGTKRERQGLSYPVDSFTIEDCDNEMRRDDLVAFLRVAAELVANFIKDQNQLFPFKSSISNSMVRTEMTLTLRKKLRRLNDFNYLNSLLTRSKSMTEFFAYVRACCASLPLISYAPNWFNNSATDKTGKMDDINDSGESNSQLIRRAYSDDIVKSKLSGSVIGHATSDPSLLKPLLLPSNPKSFSLSLSGGSTSFNINYQVYFRLLENTFFGVKLSSECSIFSLVYYERIFDIAVQTGSEYVAMITSNAEVLLLVCLMLATKMWEDESAWSFEFSKVFPKYSTPYLTKLEITLLELLDWNLLVSPEEYSMRYKYLLEESQNRFRDKRLLKYNSHNKSRTGNPSITHAQT